MIIDTQMNSISIQNNKKPLLAGGFFLFLTLKHVPIIMNVMEDLTNLKKELDEKIHNLFKDNQAYLDYVLQTMQNFLYRYMETFTDKDLKIQNVDEKTLMAVSYESNMGDAFKILDIEIKEGIKHLAKSIPRQQHPKVQYSLKTIMDDFKGDNGRIILESKVNWNFPDFTDSKGLYKKKQVVFEYHDPNVFRKLLALKYEEVCELFI
ncbi:MAG: hypothetical protein H7336_07850 [Bacteriovorax sp.]|nr:hypothetical protein [Bacteriovorax sp.]